MALCQYFAFGVREEEIKDKNLISLLGQMVQQNSVPKCCPNINLAQKQIYFNPDISLSCFNA
jgi:hypothetical protein